MNVVLNYIFVSATLEPSRMKDARASVSDFNPWKCLKVFTKKVPKHCKHNCCYQHISNVNSISKSTTNMSRKLRLIVVKQTSIDFCMWSTVVLGRISVLFATVMVQELSETVAHSKLDQSQYAVSPH